MMNDDIPPTQSGGTSAGDPPPKKPVTTVTAGTLIMGTYEIEKLINSGGMGEVYRGRNIHNDELVAIKIVLPSLAHDPKIVALFQKESTVLSRLAHEAIVRYHVFTNDPTIGRPCMVMEFVSGTALSDRIEQGPMPFEDVKVMLRRVAAGLEKAHRAGVVHRDLSPDNIILEDGKVEHAKLIDFGIAKSANFGSGTLLQGQFAGKFNWVSPEQLGAFGGQVDGRSDIYSLGLVIAGVSRGSILPMGASIVDAVSKRASVPDLTGVDPELLGLLTWMLQPDPALRIESMAQVIAALDNPALIPVATPVAEPVPDANRTVIEPLPVQTAAPRAASVPPVATGWDMPAQTDPGRVALGATVVAPVESDDISPFGAVQTPAPAPAAAVAAPPAKGKGGMVTVLAALAIAAGGAGAYFAGVFDPKPAVVDPPKAEEPQKQAVVDEPVTAPADAADKTAEAEAAAKAAEEAAAQKAADEAAAQKAAEEAAAKQAEEEAAAKKAEEEAAQKAEADAAAAKKAEEEAARKAEADAAAAKKAEEDAAAAKQAEADAAKLAAAKAALEEVRRQAAALGANRQTAETALAAALSAAGQAAQAEPAAVQALADSARQAAQQVQEAATAATAAIAALNAAAVSAATDATLAGEVKALVSTAEADLQAANQAVVSAAGAAAEADKLAVTAAAAIAAEQAAKADPVARQRKYYDTLPVSDCAYVQVANAAAAGFELNGFAQDAKALDGIAAAWLAATEAKPAIAPHLVSAEQCPVLGFASAHRGASELAVSLADAAAAIKSGAPVEGVVTGVNGRALTLFVVNGKGGVTNLKDFVTQAADGTASFKFRVKLADGLPAEPQLLVALVLDDALTALMSKVKSGTSAAGLFPYLDKQLAGTSALAAVGLGHFTLEN